MVRVSTLFSLALAFVLAACGPDPVRVPLAAAVESDLRVRVPVSTVMLRDVSLPTYAAAEEIPLQDGTGVIATAEGLLWADDPERAATLALSRHLNMILSATVAPEPWPLDGIPDVTVDVRVSEALATNTGQFVLEAQFFIGGDGRPFRPNANEFRTAVPLADTTPGAVARAQAEAYRQLAEAIARAF